MLAMTGLRYFAPRKASFEGDAVNDPAGWYEQVDGQQRYWDGGLWTDHVAPGGSPTPDHAVDASFRTSSQPHRRSPADARSREHIEQGSTASQSPERGFHTDVRPHLIPALASALLLLAATGHHPYGYFTFLRWVVFLSSCLVAWISWKSRVPPAAFLFVTAAVLFNPLAPVYMARSTWQPIDIACAGLFTLSLFITRRENSPQLESHVSAQR